EPRRNYGERPLPHIGRSRNPRLVIDPASRKDVPAGSGSSKEALVWPFRRPSDSASAFGPESDFRALVDAKWKLTVIDDKGRRLRRLTQTQSSASAGAGDEESAGSTERRARAREREETGRGEPPDWPKKLENDRSDAEHLFRERQTQFEARFGR